MKIEIFLTESEYSALQSAANLASSLELQGVFSIAEMDVLDKLAADKGIYVSCYDNGSGYMEPFHESATLEEAKEAWVTVMPTAASGTKVDVIFQSAVVATGTV